MRNRSDKRTAFTLIEVLLVIVILVALASVAVVVLWPARDEANENTTRLKIQKVMSALEEYANRLSEYPSEDQGLKALIEKPEFEDDTLGEKWRPTKIMATDLKDAWHQDLAYKLEDVDSESGTRKVPRVYSFGKNKTDDDGEEDDIRDAQWVESAKANQ